MKPKDLKRAFTFYQRRPLLEDPIFYVPIYYVDYNSFVFPELSDYFQNANQVCIEYCSGNGDWIIEKARTQPHVNWIAVEKRFDRVQKIWSKIKKFNISNLLIVSGEAYTFTHYYLPSNCIEEVFINFPDPWPKTKHAKNRLLQARFIDELARILKQNKKMTVVTDDCAFLNQILSTLCHRSDFLPYYGAPYYKIELPNYGNSWFEDLWRKKGKQIHYTQFVKNRPLNGSSV